MPTYVYGIDFGTCNSSSTIWDVERLTFNMPVQTSNGRVFDAAIRLREIRVGPITLSNVRAAVSDRERDEPVLGVSFLSRLQSYTVNGGTLTMTGAP